MKKGSPAPVRHVAVSFDDWDSPTGSPKTNLTPTVGSSTPTNTLETVLEQSAPSSPAPVVVVTETSFPYTPEKTSTRVARSLESDFNEERDANVVREGKEPLVQISGGESAGLMDPLGNIPVTNQLVEVPIDFESTDEGNSVFEDSKLKQNETNFGNELTAKLNLIDFESEEDVVTPTLLQNNSDSVTPIDSDGATIGSIRQVVGRWSANGNSLSNSVDSGLHESTDQLLDTQGLGTEYVDGSTGHRSTPIVSEGELRIGQVITVGDSKVGTIRYIGATEFASGEWVGVELELPAGKSN